ncbi:MAG: alpha/beta hydrolase [Bacteroidota bacterium]
MPSKDLTIRTVQTVLNGSYRFSTRLSGYLTYQVLVRPPKHEAEPAEEAFIAKAETAYLTDEELQLATYHWPGSGPKILLAHGWDSYSGRWYELAERLLAAGFDLYALDAPAHGHTSGGQFSVHRYAQSMTTAMHAIKPDILIGHSAGGMAAVYYFHQFQAPVRPERMVLLGTPGELTDFVESFRRVLGLSHRTIAAMDDYFVKRWDHPIAYYSVSEFAKILRLPGLVIHDEDDDVAPYAGALAITNNWAEAELMTTQGLGHSLQSEAVWQRIVDFCLAGQEER